MHVIRRRCANADARRLERQLDHGQTCARHISGKRANRRGRAVQDAVRSASTTYRGTRYTRVPIREWSVGRCCACSREHGARGMDAVFPRARPGARQRRIHFPRCRPGTRGPRRAPRPALHRSTRSASLERTGLRTAPHAWSRVECIGTVSGGCRHARTRAGHLGGGSFSRGVSCGERPSRGDRVRRSSRRACPCHTRFRLAWRLRSAEYATRAHSHATRFGAASTHLGGTS